MVVNRSLRKMLFREIRDSFTRFLSIFIMVALGTMFLVGLRSAAPDMRKTADEYFDDHDFYDIQVMSSLGLTEEDIRALAEVEGVEQVQADYSLDAVAAWKDESLVVKVLSLSSEDCLLNWNSSDTDINGINDTILVEGRYPERENECVVEQKCLEIYGLALGDKLTLSPGEDLEDVLRVREFEVVGVVESPLYISIDRGASSLGDGSIDAYVMLPGEAIDMGYIPAASILLKGASELDAYSKEYQALVDEAAQRLATVAEERGKIRYDTLQAEVQEELDAAKAELEQARTDADRELSAAKRKLDESRQQLDDGWAELNAAKEQLAAYTVWGQNEDFLAAEATLRENQEMLEDGEEDYNQGAEEYEAARAEAEETIGDAQTEIDEVQQELDQMKPAEIYVLDRNSNYGFVSYDQNAQRMENLAHMFPLIFFIVAALVCLTTMTRMVEEQRTEIGSIKAMGYGTGTIAGKFLLYGAIAALCGGVAGVAIGATLIPWVIFTSYGILYNLPSLHLELYWTLCIGAVAAGLFCTTAATLWAMLSTARQTPAALMRPKAPRAGKRIILECIPFLWKHFRFSVKVSCRNLLRYKKRFFMTVIGIAGCTALLIAGLGLHTSVFSIIEVQYGDIYRYDMLISLEAETEEQAKAPEALLAEEKNVRSMAAAYTKAATIENQEGYLTVTDDPTSLYQQITLRDMETGALVSIPKDGVLVDKKLAELLEVSVGDEITVECGKKATARVSGIVEQYVRHYVYMDADYYRQLFGETYLPNELMVSVADDSEETVEQLSGKLMELEGVSGVANITATAENFKETMNAVNAAVTVIIVSAMALALVVLYNLTNINITERIRELATIKVLGFYDGEVGMYIYRENIALTVLGIALGQVLGKFLCAYLIRTVEMDFLMFGRSASPVDYIWSVVLSAVFALLVNFMMFFRMRNIDMVQSLKSVE